jgi:hypothetical protein
MNPELNPAVDQRSALQAALDRLYAVSPMWADVLSARAAVGLEPMTLLHAGPPFADPRQPSAPVLSSAVLCCLYEGWATTETDAQAMIAEGRVRLLPAQNYRIVTPLAAVISPSTSLVQVSDGAQSDGSICWSLLGSGSGPQLRFGTRNPAILQRMAWRDEHLAPVLRALLEHSPIALIPLAIAGLQEGDDLHSRTTFATAALLQALSPSLEVSEVRAMLEATPLFFLTLWMAACYLMLDATSSADPAQATKLVLALAGNGIDAGVRLADAPEVWVTAPAHVPQGPRMQPGDLPASPMLGDSGVIDAAGFGAQAWCHTTDVAKDMRGWLPPVTHHKPVWHVGSHPDFHPFGLGCAVDAALVSHRHPTPKVAIAMLDAQGEQGLLGRGVCLTDAALFGAVPALTPVINNPASLAGLNHAFERYERALTGNDVAVLDELFWDSPHTLRYGAGEHLYGYDAIQAFRHARPGNALERTILERSVTSFDDAFAVTHIVFSRTGQARLGRQTQSWVRIAGDWRIVAAHVSWMDL